MKRKGLLCLYVLLILQAVCFTVLAQGLKVSGKISNKVTNEALPGASVTVKGTNTATLTDNQGNFTITVPQRGATLVITFLGFNTQEVVVKDATSLNITMAQGAGGDLNEVVVIGYGVQKKSVVTGSISSVKAADLDNQPITRVEQALQGRTSGLTISTNSGQPGSASTVRLRGFTSFGNGKNEPLWVVDGVVIDNGGIGYLNQDDVESYEVLKDAASAAIYGTRAAAGVILVTTKKGRAGTLRVNYSGFYGIQSPRKKLDLLNATQYATLRNQALVAAGSAPLFTNPESLGVGTDWQKEIFDYSAPKQNHELNVNGGSDKANYFVSFAYNDIKGVVTPAISKWNRINFRVNTTFKPAKWISFGENLGYSHAKNSGIGETNREFGGIVSSALNLDPLTPVRITDTATQKAFIAQSATNLAATTRDFNTGQLFGVSPYVGQEMKNPLAVVQNRLGNYGWDHNIVGNAFLDINPIQGLNIHSSLGTKLAFYGSEAFTPVAFYNTSTTINSSNYTRAENWIENWTVENTVSYNRLFGQHNVTLLAGMGEYKDGNARGTTVVYQNINITRFEQFSSRVPNLTSDRLNSSLSDGTDHRINSLFSRLQYNYGEKYLLTALIRRDGSSRFGSNNKYGYFPSASIGWVPTLENFFPKNNVLNSLKIRASYGVTGNDGIGEFAFVPLIGFGGQRNYTFGTTNVSSIGASPGAPANPDLKWEQTSQADIGIDAILLRNLTLTIDVYKKKTTGILQNPAIPGYAGYGSFAQNFDDLENTGLEVELGYRKKIGQLNLGVNGNISFYKNRVTKLLPGTTFVEDNSATFQNLGNITRTQLGEAYQRYFGYQYLGIFQSQAEIDNYVGADKVTKLQPNAKPGDLKFANLNNDNAINENDRTYLGNPNPTVSYGLTLNLGYKGFDFVVFGSGSGGNKIFQGLRRLDIASANYQTKYLDAWTATNTSATLPRIVNGDPNRNYSRFTDLYLESGNYFKIRTVQLGYTLPKSLTGKWGAQRFRVYVLGENLFTFTKYSGYDPEIGVSGDSGGGAQFGIDRGFYVPARAFVFGLNLGF